MTEQPTDPADRYRAEMGKPPPAAPDYETRRQFDYKPRRDGKATDFLVPSRSPDDENLEPLPGQETLL